MITDQKQTGVPNGNAFKTQGINQRTQLVKPNQVNNIGRSMPTNQMINQVQAPIAQAPTSPTNSSMLEQAKRDMGMGVTSATPAKSQTFNPVFPAQSMPTPTPSAAPAVPKSPEELGLAPAQNYSQMPSSASTAQSVMDNKSRARDAISQLNDSEIVELLDELASGSLRGIGSGSVL